MKPKYIMLVLPAIALLAGCVREEMDPSPESRVLTAMIEGSEDTRVSFDSVVGKFQWDENDAIDVHAGSVFLRDIVVDAVNGHFEMPANSDKRNFYAVYPSGIAVENDGLSPLEIVLPASYDISERYSSYYSQLPMVAENSAESDILLFHHVGALLRLKWVVPAGTKVVTVTFDKDVTGTYEVDVTSTSGPIITTKGNSTDNIVTFKVSEDGFSTEDAVVLNVPVPCGSYGTVTVEALGSGSGLPISQTFTHGNDASLTFGRHRGRMLVAGSKDGCTYIIGDLEDIHLSYLGGEKILSTGFVSYMLTADGDKVAIPFEFQYSESGEDGTWTTTKPEWLMFDETIDYGGTTTPRYIRTGISAQTNAAEDPHGNILKERPEKADYDLSLTVPVIPSNLPGGWDNPYADDATHSHRTTANCYVVHAPGTYKFPLVYGNGVVNGVENESSYRARQGENGSWRPDNGSFSPMHANQIPSGYFGRFKDHEYKNIMSAYIPTQLAGKTLSTALVWSDAPGLVEDVALSGDYITFSVPRENICQGNAMIAVLANGVIAWSWHIWVTDMELIPEEGPGGVLFSPVNLGWCDTKELEKYPDRKCFLRAVQVNGNATPAVLVHSDQGSMVTQGGNNPVYNWGRKDPLRNGYLRIAPTESVNQFVFKTYYTQNEMYQPRFIRESVSFETTMKNPHIQYRDSYPATYYARGWCNRFVLNLWNSTFLQPPSGIAFGVTVTKTIYDPSPVGFKVPSMDAFLGFDDSNLLIATVDQNEGRLFNSADGSQLFFPWIPVVNEWGELVYAKRFASAVPVFADVFNHNYGVFSYGGDFVSESHYNMGCSSSIRPIVD